MDPNAFLSRPVKLHFAGWESDTYRLQQAGWSLSAQQCFESGSMRIAMRHQGCQMYGITDLTAYDYFALQDLRGGNPYHSGLVLPVRHMASKLIAEFIETPSVTDFAAIDATPQFRDRRERKSIEDFAHFAVPLVRTQEVILPEENVQELMEKILKLQQPSKTEYFKRQLAEERMGMDINAIPRQRFHAQILSIAA